MAEDLRGRVVANGLETLYASDGRKQSETTYHLGVKDGPWREFYDNGNVRIEGRFRRGQKDGLETRYTETGEKSSQCNFHLGQLEGKRIEWTGRQKVYEANFSKNLLDGDLQKWHSNGTLELSAHYCAGTQEGPEQPLVFRRQKILRDQLRGGQANGEYREWFASGQPKYFATFKNGLPEGKFQEWFADGAIKGQGQYSEGSPDGVWKEWYELEDFAGRPLKSDPGGDPPAHQLSAERLYRHGILNGPQLLYHENGQKRLAVTVVDGKREGPYTEWYSNGQVRATGKYHRDQLHGEIDYWYDDGKPWAINNYDRGNPVGHWIEWDRDGKVVTDENRSR